jgi:proton-dependent oligopeptide transporter, POT family
MIAQAMHGLPTTESALNPSIADPPADTAHEGHPPVLVTLFLTEMWERFSYYGMRALLVLYLVKSGGYGRADALEVYAIYTGLVYLSGLFGGWACDRFLGFRKSILTGGFIIMLGHFAMAVPSLLNTALGLLIIGNGFFKPNISSFLGTFYREHDPRRDGAFTIFYMGVNTGAFLGPLIAGALGETVGWHWGFASAGVGMGFGLLQFWLGRARLGTGGYPPGRDGFQLRDLFDILAIAAASIALLHGALLAWPMLSPLWQAVTVPMRAAVGLLLAGWLVLDVRRHDGVGAAQQVGAIMVMCAFVIAFWMGFEQAGGTMNLFADKQTDRHLFGFEIPASFFQAINPLGIVLLGPFVAALWRRVDSGRHPWPTAAKMGLGMVILGLGFVLLYAAQVRAEAQGTVGPLWLVGVYALHTLGELCLSPVGLSMVTKLAPVRVLSLMMGFWYLANAIANYLAGVLESLLAGSGIPLYGFLVATSIGAGVVLILLAPLLRRWTHGLA